MKANKYLLLISSLLTLALLAGAAYQENFRRDWRVLQRAYQVRLSEDQAAGFSIQLRQVVVPALRVADRCTSCHVGMAAGESAIEGDPVFGRHEDVVHEPADYGCVVCHGGQGRATDEADAHGRVPHWPETMIPIEYAYAGCGSCHTHLAVPNESRLQRGRALFERYDCLACHAMDGRGGTLRPGGAGGIDGGNLSRAGVGRSGTEWYEDHLRQRRDAGGGPWIRSFDAIPEDDREAIDLFLSARVGAPGLVESKALFHSLGCRGCHKVGGVGGDDGPDLTRVGEKDPGRLDFSHVPPPHTLGSWLKEHFRSPAGVVAGSAMPALGLTEEQIDLLTFYMFSLRRSDLPEAYWPRDRILAERFDEREFAVDGATLYGTFCAACHGRGGEGMRYPGASAFPALGNADFLSLASDAFIAETVRRGRPGRRMPAWGEKEGGLRPEEIDAVVAHVRSMGGVQVEPDPRPRRWVDADPAPGGKLYAENCAVCHGDRGEGSEGTALSNRVLLQSATDTYLVETIRRGRRGTSMPAFEIGSTTHRSLSQEEIESVVAYLRTWEVTQ